MAPSYELAIDQGTTSTRAVLFDKDGQADVLKNYAVSQPVSGGSLRRQMNSQVRRRLKVPTTLDASQKMCRCAFFRSAVT
ncbi:unnamed protein product [Durusdinium trenchii]|uniref:Glycerol kinase n=1 Tax=Durusdinium trenchii TaxID=1381693 RepID=A0ABP0JAN9_9DINO